MFYFNGVASSFLLLATARNWSTLVKKAAALEKASGIRIKKYTSKKIVVLAYTINVFGLGKCNESVICFLVILIKRSSGFFKLFFTFFNSS